MCKKEKVNRKVKLLDVQISSIILFVFFYLIFQVRTSRNTFQVGEHGVSKFSLIISKFLNVSLNVLNVQEILTSKFLYIVRHANDPPS